MQTARERWKGWNGSCSPARHSGNTFEACRSALADPSAISTRFPTNRPTRSPSRDRDRSQTAQNWHNLLLNPIALRDLFVRIKEELPDWWLDRLEKFGREMVLEESRSSEPRKADAGDGQAIQ